MTRDEEIATRVETARAALLVACSFAKQAGMIAGPFNPAEIIDNPFNSCLEKPLFEAWNDGRHAAHRKGQGQ